MPNLGFKGESMSNYSKFKDFTAESVTNDFIKVKNRINEVSGDFKKISKVCEIFEKKRVLCRLN